MSPMPSSDSRRSAPRLPLSLLLITALPLALLPATASADEPPKDPLVRVTALMLKHPGVPDVQLGPLMRAFDEALKKNPRLEQKDLETRLEDFSQDKPVSEIDAAHTAYTEGIKALGGLDLPNAIKRLSTAVDELSTVLPFIKKQELADAMCALGVAYFQQGDKKEAKATFVRLLVWRADHVYDTEKFPPSVLSTFEEAKKALEKMKRGSLEIRSEPAGAQVYVDGKYIGITPAVAEGLVVGEHWITFKKEGFRKSVLSVGVSPKYQQTVTAMLERSGKYLLVEQAIAAVEKIVGQDKLDDTADNFKDFLLLDHGVFVKATAGAQPNTLNIDTFLYDLRTRERLKKVTRTVTADSPGQDVAQIVEALYTKISYEAELTVPKEAEPPKQIKRKPIYKRWWFWTIIGVAAGGVIAAGVLAPKPKNCGDGSFCPGITF